MMSIRRRLFEKRISVATIITIIAITFCLLLLPSPIEGFQDLSPSSPFKTRKHISSRAFTTTTTTTTTTWSLFNEPTEGTASTGGGGGGASVRFSDDSSNLQTMNPLDQFLSVMSSDLASIVLGAVGLLVVVIHRWSLLDGENVDTLAIQTRTDLLAVFACGSVLLNGITKLDVTAALSESVVLEGKILENPEFVVVGTNNIDIDDEKKDTISWAMNSLLDATPTKSVVLLEKRSNGNDDDEWTVVARAGIVSSSTNVPDVTPILARVGSVGNTKETYLPTLQALPGKRELTYLPTNAQLALMIPIGGGGGGDNSNISLPRRVLVLGGNTAKSFSPRDVAWCRIVADRIDQ